MERQDRRRYFRINDLVGLSYRVIDESNSADGLANADNVQISSLKLLESIDRELTEALNHLWQSNPAAANVIGLLNRKIEFLTAEMGLDYAAQAIQHEQTQVNISACGMAFESAEHFATGQLLEIHVQLKPANTRLKLQGFITACEHAPVGSKNPYFLRIDFTNIDTHMQEALIQHIVRRQSMLLNEQRREQT